MALYTGRLLIRGGNESDFDPDKMMPREWAVSTDKGMVRICVKPGVCIRMATYDAFEEDMAKIENILKECQTIQEVVVRINMEVSQNADAVAEYTAQAKKYRDEAKTSADNAKISETNAKTSETNAKASENNAKLSEEHAQAVFESLPEDYGTLSKEFYEVAIKQKASGEDIHVTDSANAKVREFALFGKAKQQTTSGNQLLNYEAWKTVGVVNGSAVFENNGIKLTANAKDSYTQYNPVNISEDNLIPVVEGDKIHVSWEENSNIGGRVFIFGNGTDVLVQDNNNKVKVVSCTIPSGVNFVTIRFGVDNAGDTISYKNIMINKGTTALPWEKFTGGQPSPNPRYEQPIEVSGASYNLLENTATSKTINGVEFVVNEDKSITVNGTASANATLELTSTNLVLEEKCYLSGISGGSVDTYSIQASNITTAKWFHCSSGDVEIPSGEYDRVIIRINNGVTVNNLTFYPMIRKATVKNDRYMPYGKGSVEVKSVGKNLLENTATSNTVNGVEFVVNEDGSVTANGTSTGEIQVTVCTIVLKSGEYKLSGCPKNATGYRLDVRYGEIIVVDTGDGGTISITEDTTVKCYIRIWTGNTLNNVVFYPMIRLASDTDDTYEPYKETLVTIPTPNGLAGIKVSSNGNYTDQNGQQWICDEIVKYADGSGEFVKRVEKYTVTGNETINKSSLQTVDRYLLSLPFDSSVSFSNLKNKCAMCSKGICEIFTVVGANLNTTVGHFNIDINASKMRLAYNYGEYGKTTQEDFKNSIVGAEVFFVLAEPIHTPLTAEEIAEIEKLHTFYPVTNISNDFDCGMSVTYYCDSKNYIGNQLAIMKKEQEEAMANMLLLMPTEVQAMMIENDTNDLLKESEI